MNNNFKSIFVPLMFLLLIFFIILLLFGCKYYSYTSNQKQISKFNLQYEEYNLESINGLDLATLMNKAISYNESIGIEKDDENYFILNDDTSIEIYVKMIINNTTYKMENFSKVGMTQFIQSFADINFKCTNVTYHNTTGQIASMTFEATEY